MNDAPSPTVFDLFETLYQYYFDFTSCVAIVLINSASLFLQCRRSTYSTRCGTLSMLLITFICYGLFNIPGLVLRALPWDQRKAIFAQHDQLVWVAALSPYLCDQMVSVSGALLILDRVLIMACPLRYFSRPFSASLGLAVLLLNSVGVLLFVLLVFFGDRSQLIYDLHNALKHYVLSCTLAIESLLYGVFLLKVRSFFKHRANGSAEHRKCHADQIVFFQMVAHTLLCTIPNALFCVSVNTALGEKVKWLHYAVAFSEPMFCASVLATSLFTLYRLVPRTSIASIS
ncbi:hypothetical protein QR680_008897 [Steinernema hermaphroditum]|uniref:Uncharacterized protein n=1 Tax=Steinernema hermaphroditum TaxID=289476 RepID=A0AA39IJT8_9BILA|nr:hypothetical protein QR680_008897 [Steinernema hermaphroditum]